MLNATYCSSGFSLLSFQFSLPFSPPHLVLSSIKTLLPLSFPSLQFPLQSFFFLVFLASSLGAVLPFIYSAFKPKPLNATRESHKIFCFDTTVSFSVAFYLVLLGFSFKLTQKLHEQYKKVPFPLHRFSVNCYAFSHQLYIVSLSFSV